jgi:hypothetical protein
MGGCVGWVGLLPPSNVYISHEKKFTSKIKIKKFMMGLRSRENGF